MPRLNFSLADVPKTFEGV